jgi:hypothetical protein
MIMAVEEIESFEFKYFSSQNSNKITDISQIFYLSVYFLS